MHCNYCAIKYNVIARVENFDNYLQYIAGKSNITSFLRIENQAIYHIHPSGGTRYSSPPKNFSKKDKERKVIDYFSQLNELQLRRLYEMYQIDFELFGYTEYPYVKSVRNIE